MASTFRRKGSKFLWIKYRDPSTGKVVRRSTKLDVALPTSKRKAAAERAKLALKESTSPIVRERERWEAWVGEFLAARYVGKSCLKNANQAFRDLLAYFAELEIATPRQVTYDVARGFVPWKMDPKKTKAVGANTARQRFVYFTVIMAEAVRRGFTDVNPCREVEVRKVKAKEKHEITEDDEVKILAELERRPEWMRDQWTILTCQGCRIAETNIPLSRISTKDRTITLKIKGGRLHIATLHDNLLPLVEKAKAAGRDTLLEVENVQSWAPTWCAFFKKLGMPYSIHCTRVTVITRLVRIGVSVERICNLIGHTEEVNKIYRKLKPQDSRELLAFLGRAPSRAAGSHTPESPR